MLGHVHSGWQRRLTARAAAVVLTGVFATAVTALVSPATGMASLGRSVAVPYGQWDGSAAAVNQEIEWP
ncbi:hypothetical protein GCM10010145_44500 [Streptomyces ruber]|uniref:Uncharacterized protein n=2 Tax=Streptomyces TaxID=1883 RepID=A0A918EVZ8_9ACTN|nr:hypothetical protein GCM10010145_44500 [Streptomyces ruber]